MHLARDDSGVDHVVTLSGDVRRGDLEALRAGLLEAVNGDVATGGDAADLIVDVRSLTSFDGLAFAALVAARSRAKWLRRRIVVVDGAGPTRAGLRRTGLHARFPVFETLDEASRELAVLRRPVGLFWSSPARTGATLPEVQDSRAE